MKELAARHGFKWTIFRPQVVFGGAAGAAMNPVAVIGAYAALCRKLALPFTYPAGVRTVWEATDAALLAEALVWARNTPPAHGETFNVTNGDVFVLRDAWNELAEWMGLEPCYQQGTSLVDFLASGGAIEAWKSLATEHRLQVPDLASLVGQSHHYVDMLLDERMVQRGNLPTLVSSIKIRKAGFGACMDSLDSMRGWLRRMAGTSLLPRF